MKNTFQKTARLSETITARLSAPFGSRRTLAVRRRPVDARKDIQFEINRQHFTVKLARSKREIIQAYALRYQVFHREYVGRHFPIGIDTDRFDRLGDMLIIVDNRVKRVVGAYRLLSSKFTDQFYSSGEFCLDEFLRADGVKLELSRACVEKGYRTGSVIHLLWRGIAAYMQAVEASWLFGCSSVTTTDVATLHELYRQLMDSRAIREDVRVAPRDPYRIPDFERWLERFRNEEPSAPNQATIPPLLRSYLKAGARVFSEPALDRKYRCIDLLTVLDVEALSKSYEKKYIAK